MRIVSQCQFVKSTLTMPKKLSYRGMADNVLHG